MGLNHSPSIVTNGLVLCLDAANIKSRLGTTNLIASPEELATYAANQTVTITQSGPYIRVSAGQTTSTPGTYPIGGLITVSTNTQYTFRIRARKINGTTPSLFVQGETTGLIAYGTVFLTTDLQWLEVTFNSTTNTSVGVGILWFSPLLGSTLEIETSGLYRTDIWYDISGNSNDLTIYGNPTFNSSGYFTFSNDQTTQYMMRTPFSNPTTAVTYSCWFRSNFNSSIQTPFTYSVNGNNEMLMFINSPTLLTPHPKGISVDVATTNMTNVWVNFTWTRLSSTGVNVFYRDGIQIGTYTNSVGVNITSGGYLIIGQESDAAGGGFDANQNLDGDFARLDVYNKVLTPNEVLHNFNALRGRFGI